MRNRLPLRVYCTVVAAAGMAGLLGAAVWTSLAVRTVGMDCGWPEPAVLHTELLLTPSPSDLERVGELYRSWVGTEPPPARVAAAVLFVHGHRGDMGQAAAFTAALHSLQPHLPVFVTSFRGAASWTAFHSHLQDRQAAFLIDAARYLEEHFSANRLIVVAHSMGGVVALLAMSHPQYQPGRFVAVFALNSPLRQHPLAADAAVASLYRKAHAVLQDPAILSDTVLISLSSGAGDTLVRTELTSVAGLIAPAHGFTALLTDLAWTVTGHDNVLSCGRAVRAVAAQVGSLFQVLDDGGQASQPPARTSPAELVELLRSQLTSSALAALFQPAAVHTRHPNNLDLTAAPVCASLYGTHPSPWTFVSSWSPLGVHLQANDTGSNAQPVSMRTLQLPDWGTSSDTVWLIRADFESEPGKLVQGAQLCFLPPVGASPLRAPVQLPHFDWSLQHQLAASQDSLGHRHHWQLEAAHGLVASLVIPEVLSPYVSYSIAVRQGACAVAPGAAVVEPVVLYSALPLLELDTCSSCESTLLLPTLAAEDYSTSLLRAFSLSVHGHVAPAEGQSAASYLYLIADSRCEYAVDMTADTVSFIGNWLHHRAEWVVAALFSLWLMWLTQQQAVATADGLTVLGLLKAAPWMAAVIVAQTILLIVGQHIVASSAGVASLSWVPLSETGPTAADAILSHIIASISFCMIAITCDVLRGCSAWLHTVTGQSSASSRSARVESDAAPLQVVSDGPDADSSASSDISLAIRKRRELRNPEQVTEHPVPVGIIAASSIWGARSGRAPGELVRWLLTGASQPLARERLSEPPPSALAGSERFYYVIKILLPTAALLYVPWLAVLCVWVWQLGKWVAAGQLKAGGPRPHPLDALGYAGCAIGLSTTKIIYSLQVVATGAHPFHRDVLYVLPIAALLCNSWRRAVPVPVTAAIRRSWTTAMLSTLAWSCFLLCSNHVYWVPALSAMAATALVAGQLAHAR